MPEPKTYYFDSNATTGVAPEVLEAMLPYLTAKWGNPSSPYRFGKQLVEPIEKARESVAALIGADAREIIFTSCGTESINTAITSCLHAQPGKRHIVTTAVEHSATKNSCAALAERGYDVTFLPVNRDGSLDLAKFESALRADTAVVSIMWANNETGVLFPIAELAAICRRRGILIHTDAVQVPGKLKLDVNALGVDLLSLSAHKLHGPKGVGLLYVRKGTPFHPLIIGGHQEDGNRGGTENVPYIVGFGRAAELARAVSPEAQRKLAALRDQFENEILSKIPQASRNGAKEPRLPNTTSIAFAGVEAEALLMQLDQLGILASSGSACTTGSVAPSHVLTAMGLGPVEARSTIRFSLDYETTEADVAYVLAHLPRIVAELRAAASPRTGARPVHRTVPSLRDESASGIATGSTEDSPAALQSRTEKLREYVREVPLYRAAAKAGTNATWSELLAAIPFTTKQDIKTDFPKNFLRAGQSLDELVDKKLIEIEHTAGTTDNRADLLLPHGWWARQEAWALSLNSHVAQVLAENPNAHRVTISSPACNGDISYSNGTPSAQRRTLGNTRVLSLSRFPFLLSTGDLDQMIAEAQEWDPVFLDTDPVYAVVFALHCERRKVRFPKLKFILTSYEYTSVLHKRILERVFGVPVYNLYGSTETGHLIMEQAAGGMVASKRIAHLEVINTDERGVGELVVSTLTNDYMPLLNYRIGDLVERKNGTYVLHGRAPDTLKTPDGRRVTTRDIDQCFVGAEGLQHYRLHEIAPGNFVLNWIAEGVGDPRAAVAAAVQKLAQLIKPAGKIETKEVNFLLPEGSGKFVFSYPFVA
jgi:cysteine desulfurase